MNQEMSMIDKILDENNSDPVVLYDENNKETKFEQVAVIPLDEKLYVLLKPITRERTRQIYNIAKKKKEALMKRNMTDIISKAENLAEFETKIGIPLDIFIKIFTDGIYSKEFGPLHPDDFHVVCNLRGTEPYIEHIHDVWYHNKFLIRDYGKTWRLLLSKLSIMG